MHMNIQYIYICITNIYMNIYIHTYAYSFSQNKAYVNYMLF